MLFVCLLRLLQGFGVPASGVVKQRSLKRSCTEASQNFRERAAAARCSSPSTYAVCSRWFVRK
jgi:hypothetical protein